MPPGDSATGSARDWLWRARGKLALARQPLPVEGFLEDLCFFAQQAAELAIKAVYQRCGWSFPFVHDLGTLLDGLQAHGMALPPAVRAADELTVYAAETRYPGSYAPVLRQEHEQAVKAATEVVAWAESLVEPPHPEGGSDA